jgi:hypothetical protein
MQSINERESEIAKIAESREARAALQKHLEEIVEGAGFRGSHRSGQFLKYIVDQAVAGRFESLKERVIGVELFGRAPSYDTGEDAIVRVTASDVRKRLLQHYGSCEALPEFRINLPLGSYVPEIIREHPGDGHALETKETHPDSQIATPITAAEHQEPHPLLSVAPQAVESAPSANAPAEARPKLWPLIQLLSIAVLIAALGLTLLGLIWKRTQHTETPTAAILPWSAFFNSSHPTHLITSDPDIADIRRITGGEPISVSDYANRNFIPADIALPAQVKSICENLMRGDKAASIDTQIAVNIAELAQSNSKRIDVVGARYIQFSNLRSDDNFIFLGSPWTDPWFSLFNDHLDFRIDFDKASGDEFIRNVHPGTNEQELYVPTARGGATGVSYAVIAFLQNPDQNGQVLLLAGINGEGTQAVGRLVTDLPRLGASLKSCGIPTANPLKHFEMLLRVKTMASSPSEFDVIACHALPGAAL